MPNSVNQQSADQRTQCDEPADARRAGTSAFARTMLVLDTITDGTAFRFSELQSLTGLPKASLHRALTDLTDQRLVVFDHQSNTYSAGFRLLEWANRIWSRNDLRKLAHDILDDLSAETGETVMLSVLADTHVVHLDCVESAQSVRTSVSVGHRVPAWCTAAGKALLAQSSLEQQRTVLNRTAFARYTGNTVTDPEAVLDQLRLVAEVGFAEDNEEHHVGIRCVAAPIIDGSGVAVAAISVSAPTFRVVAPGFDLWRDRVQASAKTIGQRLLPNGSAAPL